PAPRRRRARASSRSSRSPSPERVHFYFGKKKGNHIINNASDLCMYLLHEAHVSSVMGDAFGEPSCVRFSFANNIEKIEEGWKRIKKALAQLQ
nr:aspartate aminotransferase [Chitinophagaceae bacterium]